MARPKIDKSICYKCKLSEPHVIMPLHNGKPRGICKACRNALEQIKRNKASLYKDFYNTSRKLADYNYKLLASLSLGSYPLELRTTKQVIGHITIKSGQVFALTWTDRALYKQDLYGLSLWLSNLNLAIQTKPIEATDTGDDLEAKSVAETLYMFDVTLQEYAYKRLKRELDDAKAKTRVKAFK